MKHLLVLGGLLMLTACGGSNNNNNNGTAPPAPVEPEPVTNAIFDIGIVNLTAAQPFSPVAALVLDDDTRLFTVGEPASVSLETMAEGGDNSALLDAVASLAEVSGSAPVGPGASDTLSLEIEGDDTTGLRLSVLTMLVNTNDAFTGVNAIDISGLAVGEAMTISGSSYDSGTEANTEAAGTIPGPADGGEGFNADRDDIGDQVTRHGGAVTAADGLGSSTLGQVHRWDNPVARFHITRVQ